MKDIGTFIEANTIAIAHLFFGIPATGCIIQRRKHLSWPASMVYLDLIVSCQFLTNRVTVSGNAMQYHGWKPCHRMSTKY